MAEPKHPAVYDAPPFDEIARAWLGSTGWMGQHDPAIISELAEQLRQVWNARGAADIEAVQAPQTMSEGMRRLVTAMIRKIDR